MIVTVSRQESDLHTVDLPDQYLIRRLSERCVREYFLLEFESLRIVYSGPSDYSDLRHDHMNNVGV